MGSMKFGNGDRYEGQWKNDLPHGKGEMIYANKDTFVGTWRSGKVSPFSFSFLCFLFPIFFSFSFPPCLSPTSFHSPPVSRNRRSHLQWHQNRGEMGDGTAGGKHKSECRCTSSSGALECFEDRDSEYNRW